MQANETLLELWIDALCAELSELSGALITPSTAPYEGKHQDAYETALLAQGPVQGELHITADASGLVQFTQLSSGEPLDPEMACNPERIEAWRRLLDSAANRLSAKLTADFTDSRNSRCVILLADTRPLLDGDPLSGEPGSRIQRWLLQAGQSQIAILARARIEFPEEAASATQVPEPAVVDDAESFQAASAAPGEDTGGSSTQSNPWNQTVSQQEGRDATSAEEIKHRARRYSDKPLASPEQSHRLDLLLDIELEATLRFGAIEMPLREVLELGPGDVLSLDRHVQEPVELVVGDRIVARGEVVLIGGNFGLQVTEVAEPRRRLETIRCLF